MLTNNMDESFPRAEQPTSFINRMRKDQLTSLYAMKYLEHYKTTEFITSDNIVYNMDLSIGILGNNVGAGKTIEMLALIRDSPAPPRSSIYWTYTNFNTPQLPISLLVVPHGLLPIWVQTIEEWDPTFKYFAVINRNRIQKFQKMLDDENYPHIVLVSSTMFSDFTEKYARLHWSRLIYEEADSINIPNNLKVDADFTWLITATPDKLYNIRNNGYLKHLIVKLSNMLTGYNEIMIRNNPEYTKSCIELPKIIWRTLQCLCPPELQMNTMVGFLSESIMSRINAGDVQGAIRALDLPTYDGDDLVTAVTMKIQMKINKLEKMIEKCEITEKKNEYYTRLKGLQNRKKLIETRVNDMGDNSCPICLEELKDESHPTMSSCCNQWFCFECIMKCKGKCPMCRSKFKVEDLNVMSDVNKIKKEVKHKKDEKISKLDQLMELLEEENHRTLVFSDYEETFNQIIEKLDQKKMKYAELKGHGKTIHKIQGDFRKGKIDILMLNSKHQGAGHNLEKATRVVLFHAHPSYVQVIGRAQRYGRDCPLEVISLLYEHERMPVKCFE